MTRYACAKDLKKIRNLTRVLNSVCDREYVWEHGNMTENFSDECALREFMCYVRPSMNRIRRERESSNSETAAAAVKTTSCNWEM